MTATPRATSLASEAATAFDDYRSGKTGRIADLVALLTPALWAVARSSGLSTSQAEDVVQTTWVRLVQKAETIREPQAVFGWLLTTTKRESWRAAGRVEPVTLDHDEVDTSPAVDDQVTDDLMNQRLWRHVTALSPRCQALLRVIAFASTPDYASISTALGMPVGSIGPTRGRCLASLRAALANDPQWSL